MLGNASIVEIEQTDFQAKYPEMKADSEEIVSGLDEESDLATDPVWNKLPGGSDADEDRHEDDAYKSLIDVYRHIVKGCRKNGKPKRARPLHLRPKQPPKSEKENSSQPDGAICRGTKERAACKRHAYRWCNIGVVLEFKRRGRKDVGKMDRTNVEKLNWGMTHVMWDNIERRFVFGVTMEGSTARVWRADRSVVYVSTPFDLHKNRVDVIRMFASFAFASDEALGWDPTFTIKRDKEYKRKTTAVRFKDISYTITRIIADNRARELHGSGCRVFQAVDPNGKVAAIKDVRNKTRTPEGDIWKEVRRAIEAIPAEDRKLPDDRTIEDYFVNVVAHGDVVVNGTTDDTAETDTETWMSARKIDTDRLTSGGNKTITTTARNSEGPNSNSEGPNGGGVVRPKRVEAGTSLTLRGDTRQIRIDHRVHYRTVMENVGEPLHHVSNLQRAFNALCDVVQACKLMCLAGYNHRDLSPGNIIVDDSGRGRLGDLEFAKRYRSEQDGHAERTVSWAWCP
ncbi:hypothetical protein CALVIDRAFT_410998 [Calocera viscosa TUFC12733]|uniref:Fungal-type protein kinase domain-containing protein n=1 Tax=Calocera viscosa (strain TUFC12733) TaxID=1330018 RepID=A0A167G7D6_CALVF|nr:hypothetical protein CALVIDRAFT_410998 [Calocera viscosa TUFC12733]